MPFRVGLLVYPRLTQLDLTGPYEIFCRAPGFEVQLIGKTRGLVRTEHGFAIETTASFADDPPLDLICVPGGPGVNDLLTDAETLDYLRRAAGSARYLTSVCTGSLLLGAAGLLRGKRAACHWTSRHFLAEFGATPDPARVVCDGNVITGGGVTAGIDFGLRVVAEVLDEATAKEIQLMIEYAPEPPFAGGRPETAGDDVTSAVQARIEERLRERAEAVRRAAAAL